MKNWIVLTFKKNELNDLKFNLSKQKFDYYLPKILKKKTNCNPKEEPLFPGYIFVKVRLEYFSALKYTRGVKKILKFGGNIACLSDNDISDIKIIEESQLIGDLEKNQLKIGHEVFINKGFLKGYIGKISSFSSKKRVDVLLNFLGTLRTVKIPEEFIKS